MINIQTSSKASMAEFGELPRRGPDPVCGLRRTAIYALEKAGQIRLVRVRQPGRLVGRVLIDYASVRRFFDKLAREDATLRNPAAKGKGTSKTSAATLAQEGGAE